MRSVNSSVLKVKMDCACTSLVLNWPGDVYSSVPNFQMKCACVAAANHAAGIALAAMLTVRLPALK